MLHVRKLVWSSNTCTVYSTTKAFKPSTFQSLPQWVGGGLTVESGRGAEYIGGRGPDYSQQQLSPESALSLVSPPAPFTSIKKRSYHHPLMLAEPQSLCVPAHTSTYLPPEHLLHMHVQQRQEEHEAQNTKCCHSVTQGYIAYHKHPIDANEWMVCTEFWPREPESPPAQSSLLLHAGHFAPTWFCLYPVPPASQVL